MNPQTRTGLAALALVLILASFGLDWFHLTGATMQSMTVNGQEMSFPGAMPMGGQVVSMTVGAWNGHLTIAGLKLDIWLVAALGCVGAGLAIASALVPDRLPRFAPLAVLGFVGVYLGGALVGLIGSGAGIAPGFVAAVVGVVVAIATQVRRERSVA